MAPAPTPVHAPAPDHSPAPDSNPVPDPAPAPAPAPAPSQVFTDLDYCGKRFGDNRRLQYTALCSLVT